MKNSFRIIISFFLLLIAHVGLAQQQPEMADSMREDGKIYVVVAIILIVLAGLIIYLFALDRKISKLEDRLK